jgi:uncharacterized delta-60 repeat protein
MVARREVPFARPVARRAVLHAIVALAMVAVTLPGSQPEPSLLAEPGLGAGDLDATFDEDGIKITEISSLVGTTHAVRQTLSDGTDRVLVLESVNRRVWRFLPDGSLDLAFDDDGVLPVAAPGLSPIRLAARSDGGFVVAGTVGPVTTTAALVGAALYDENGGLDTAYGDNGLAVVELAEPDDTFLGVTDVGVQSASTGHRVIIVGPGIAGNDEAIMVARLTTDGSGADVTEARGFDFEVDELAPRAMTIMDDDRIVVTGIWRGAIVQSVPAATTPAAPPMLLAAASSTSPTCATSSSGSDGVVGPPPDGIVAIRYSPGLAEDPTFGVSGAVFRTGGAGASLRPAVQSDGALVVVDLPSPAPSPPAWLVHRWEVDGTFIATTTTPFPGASSVFPSDVEVAADDRVFVVGTAGLTGEPSAVAVADYTAEGQNESALIIPHPGDPEPTGISGRSLVPMADGTFVVAGTAVPQVAGLTLSQILLMGFDEDLLHDEAYGGTGFVVHNGGRVDRAHAHAVQPDRQIVAVGATEETGPTAWDSFVLRHQEDGLLDETFSPAAPTGIEVVVGTSLRARDVALEDGGAIVLGGETGNGPCGAVQKRLTDGSADPDFNGGLPFRIAVGAVSTRFHGVAVDDEGRTIAVGEAIDQGDSLGPRQHIVVARVLADGSTTDPDFGTDGIVTIGPMATASGMAVTLDDAGRIVIAGMATPGQGDFTPQLLVARLLTDGSGDAGFGVHPNYGAGVVLGPPDLYGADVTVRPGRVIVVGTERTAPADIPTMRGFVAEFDDDGAPATDFGSGGLVFPFPADSQATGVALDAVGNVVVSGGAYQLAGETFESFQPQDILLGRVLPTGELDPAFGVDGLVTTDVGGGELATDVAIAPDEKIVISGYVTDDRSTRVLVARYNPGATLLCQPVAIDFGTVVVEETAEETITCTNQGPGQITISAITLNGGATGDFTTETPDCLGAPLAPLASCTVTVSFTPSEEGDRSTLLEVEHTGLDALDQVDLRGVGEILTATLECVPAALAFGALPIGESNGSLVTCTNLGPADLTITSIALAGSHGTDFSATTGACLGVTLVVATSCQIAVGFSPSAAGSRWALLRVIHTGIDILDLVELRGQGIPEVVVAGTPAFAAEPDPVDFGELLARSLSPAQLVTVSNVGDAPMSITAVVVDGPQQDDFTITSSTCSGVTLAPAETCVVAVTYAPIHNLSPARLGFLRFSDNAPGNPHVVVLQGTVTQPEVFVSPAVVRQRRVTTVVGRGFPAGDQILIRFESRFLEWANTTAAADGTFRVQLPLFAGTPQGTRELFARSPNPAVPTDPAQAVEATTPLLVTTATIQPPGFASRS